MTVGRWIVGLPVYSPTDRNPKTINLKAVQTEAK